MLGLLASLHLSVLHCATLNNVPQCTVLHCTALYCTHCNNVLGCTAQNLTVQVQLENLTTNHIYSVKVAAASESIYTPGQVLDAVYGIQWAMNSV